MSLSSSKFLDITAKTKVLAVIGDPIEHSMSPTMHNAAINRLDLDYVYIAFHVTNDNLQAACDGFRALNVQGINVTIPHKVAIMPYLDEIDPIAKGIGAINTIKNVEGRLLGRNTDGDGMIMALNDSGFDPNGKKCVMIGAGGAARAMAFILGTKALEITLCDLYPEVAEKLKANLEIFFGEPELKKKLKLKKSPIFRTIPIESEALQREINDCHLLINATPIGMAPDNMGKSPLDDFDIQLSSQPFVFDVVYNPMETKFLADAREAGCQTLGGINMLVNQGAIAFEWWTGIKPDAQIMTEAAIKKLNIH